MTHPDTQPSGIGIKPTDHWIAALERFYPNTGDQVIEWRRDGARKIIREAQADALRHSQSQPSDRSMRSAEEWEYGSWPAPLHAMEQRLDFIRDIQDDALASRSTIDSD
jgi:hypothetical protein